MSRTFKDFDKKKQPAPPRPQGRGGMRNLLKEAVEERLEEEEKVEEQGE